jgi:hypothetical protein
MTDRSEASGGATAPERVLVAYYTLGGTTARLADRLGAAFGAEVLPIVEQRPRRLTPVGVVRSILDGARGRASKVDALPVDPGDYDLVLVGGPCWAGGAAGPVLGFLARYRDRLGPVVGIATAGKAADQKVFDRMERVLGRPLADRLIVGVGDLDGGGADQAVRALAERCGIADA